MLPSINPLTSSQKYHESWFRSFLQLFYFLLLLLFLFVYNQIIEGVYVGNFRDSKDEAQLKENGITHILSIHDNARPLLKVR